MGADMRQCISAPFGRSLISSESYRCSGRDGFTLYEDKLDGEISRNSSGIDFSYMGKFVCVL